MGTHDLQRGGPISLESTRHFPVVVELLYVYGVHCASESHFSYPQTSNSDVLPTPPRGDGYKKASFLHSSAPLTDYIINPRDWKCRDR
jgi:hypothetical protein